MPHYKEVGLDDVCFATKVTYKIDVDIYLRHSCSDRDFIINNSVNARPVELQILERVLLRILNLAE